MARWMLPPGYHCWGTQQDAETSMVGAPSSWINSTGVLSNLLNTFIDSLFDSNQTQWVTIINKKRKAFVCTLWDLAAPGEKRHPFPGIYKAKCIPSREHHRGRMAVLKRNKSVACYARLKLTSYEWSSHGVDVKLYLLSKGIPDCHKLSKIGCDEQNTEMVEQVNSKDGVAWSQGFAWTEGEQTKARKMKLTR